MNFFSVPTSSTTHPSKRSASSSELNNQRQNEYIIKADDRNADSPSHHVHSKREDSEANEITLMGPVVSRDEPTKLFSLISQRQWDAVVKRCRGEDAKEAMTWVVEKNRDNSIRWKLLPIHHACETKAPSEVVKALIAAYPDSLLLKDSAGNLPLHLACRERASKSVIGAILSEEPAAAKIPDGEGRLALHLASRQGTDVKIVDSLILCFFRGACTPDAYQLLPIHWACAQNASPALVESLLHANPDSTDLKDQWGRTPLSLAHASTNPNKEAVIEALNRDPSYWNRKVVDEIKSLNFKVEESNRKVKQVEESLMQKLEESDKKGKEIEESLTLQLEASNRKNKQAEEQVKALIKENEKLKEEVRSLSSLKKYSEEDMEAMHDENCKMLMNIQSFQSRLKVHADLFRSMESQRVTLLKVAEDMDTSIKKASDLSIQTTIKLSDDHISKHRRCINATEEKNRTSGNFDDMD